MRFVLQNAQMYVSANSRWDKKIFSCYYGHPEISTKTKVLIFWLTCGAEEEICSPHQPGLGFVKKLQWYIWMCIKEEQIEDAWWSLILFCWLELNIPGLAWICSPLSCSQLACREKWESSIKKANSSLLFTIRWLLWFTWRRPRWSLCNWEGPLPRILAPWRQSV